VDGESQCDGLNGSLDLAEGKSKSLIPFISCAFEADKSRVKSYGKSDLHADACIARRALSLENRTWIGHPQIWHIHTGAGLLMP
jgi:hypothetical protein